MPQEMIGRRIPVLDQWADPYALLTQAGDYYGPTEYGARPGAKAVWFLLPTARDEDAIPDARSLHHIESPPHVFIEEPDGTLTARESILAGPQMGGYWHGYLTAGRWELNKSKP